MCDYVISWFQIQNPASNQNLFGFVFEIQHEPIRFVLSEHLHSCTFHDFHMMAEKERWLTVI